MIEFDLRTQQDAARVPLPMTVIGLGGAGCNVLDTIALDGLPDARLVAMNTDVRALQNAMSVVRIQLGRELTHGVGAGGDPELGSEAASISAAEIREQVSGQQMVFLCVGLGGGTGSGAAPLVARLAREAGGFVVVFAMMPFAFEGRRRVSQAQEALDLLRREANAVVTFDNDRIGELVLPKKGIQEAFAAADRIVGQSIRAIINLVSRPSLIHVGMDGLIAALRNEESRCLFGFGMATGENRALDALRQALKSPLLDHGHPLKHSSRVLVHICGGPQLTILEVQELMTQLARHLHEETHVLFGTGIDPRMDDQVSVTILTSIGSAPPIEARATELPATSCEPEASEPTPAPAIVEREIGTESSGIAADEVETVEPQPVETELEDVAGYSSEIEYESSAPEYETETATVDDPIDPAASESDYVDADEVPAEPVAEESLPAASSRGFKLRQLTSKRHPPASTGPAPGGRATFFQSWRREQERLSSLPPQPPEQVAPVSDFGDTPVADEPPLQSERRTGPRLPTFLDRLRHHGPPPAATGTPQEQSTFDESLQPASRGRFDKVDPTIEDGQDLDVPTFLRRKPR
jgi:cell division protein FtsZ